MPLGIEQCILFMLAVSQRGWYDFLVLHNAFARAAHRQVDILGKEAGEMELFFVTKRVDDRTLSCRLLPEGLDCQKNLEELRRDITDLAGVSKQPTLHNRKGSKKRDTLHITVRPDATLNDVEASVRRLLEKRRIKAAEVVV